MGLSTSTDAPVSGGVTSVLGGVAKTQLSPIGTPCRQLSIRSHVGNTEMSIGGKDVGPGTRWAFILEGETWSLGPFQPGVGIRPCDIYLIGGTLEAVTWVGIHS